MSNFPQVIDPWVDKIDRSVDGTDIVDETIAIPSSSPYEMYLDHVPKDTASTRINSAALFGGTEFTEVTSGTPASNEFLVDYVTGNVVFSSANTGQTVYATYKNLGDTPLAAHINDLQTAINNIQTALGTLPGGTQVDGVLAGIIDSSGVIKGTVDLGTEVGHWVNVPGYIKNFDRTDGAVRIGLLSDLADLVISNDLWVAGSLYPSSIHASGSLRADGDVKLGDSVNDKVEIVGAITNPSGVVQIDSLTGLGNPATPAALQMYDTGTFSYKIATLVSGTLVWS